MTLPSTYVRDATLADVYDMAPKLREADKQEIKAASGFNPWKGLEACYDSSDRPMVFLAPDGEAVGMYGCHKGAIWMLCTPRVETMQKRFLRNAIPVVEDLNKQYPVLFNCVDARNTVHIKWLRWMGFTFINLHKHFGFEKRPFYEFVRISTNV